MSLDARLERLFHQSAGAVDSFLRSLVSGLDYRPLSLREGSCAVDDFIAKYDYHLKRCSRKTRGEVLEVLEKVRTEGSIEKSDAAVAFVMRGLDDMVYYTPVLFEECSRDDEFEYVFCHEIVHSRHQGNYSKHKTTDVDALLNSYCDVNELDELLVDCTLSALFDYEDENWLSDLVQKHGLSYVWRMALNHEVWEKF